MEIKGTHLSSSLNLLGSMISTINLLNAADICTTEPLCILKLASALAIKCDSKFKGKFYKHMTSDRTILSIL